MPAKKKQAKATKRWSKKVTETSDAMTLENSVFKKTDAKEIALSLKRSSARSHRRKTTPFRSAMSMLNFYINRAGDNISAKQKETLEKAKDELRIVFNRQPSDK